MHQYILLGNFTDEGLRKLEKFPNRDKAARNLIEKSGGGLQIYYTMGEYDFVAIVNMPDEESMLQLLIKMGKIGDVKTKTLKSWSESEFHEAINNL
jgi:uncharacterized protein with GYD domain